MWRRTLAYGYWTRPLNFSEDRAPPASRFVQWRTPLGFPMARFVTTSAIDQDWSPPCSTVSPCATPGRPMPTSPLRWNTGSGPAEPWRWPATSCSLWRLATPRSDLRSCVPETGSSPSPLNRWVQRRHRPSSQPWTGCSSTPWSGGGLAPMTSVMLWRGSLVQHERGPPAGRRPGLLRSDRWTLRPRVASEEGFDLEVLRRRADHGLRPRPAEQRRAESRPGGSMPKPRATTPQVVGEVNAIDQRHQVQPREVGGSMVARANSVAAANRRLTADPPGHLAGPLGSLRLGGTPRGRRLRLQSRPAAAADALNRSVFAGLIRRGGAP